MPLINEDSQYELEKQIREQLSRLGQKIFNIEEIPLETRLLYVAINKKIVEYFDNTRLLQTKPMELPQL